MVPILWRYLSLSYLRILALSVSGFVGVLIVMRMQEIARFATSGAPMLKVFLFAALQIPYILPIAIPISCLIAALILFQRLSGSHELTAFRSCGVSMRLIKMPLIYAAIALSLLNFTIVSEVSPQCRALSKKLIVEVVKNNPLFLLKRDSLVKLKNAYYNIGNLKENTHAENVMLVTKNDNNKSVNLMIAKDLYANGNELLGDQVTFISSMQAEKMPTGFDHLIIENQAHMVTDSEPVTQLIQTISWEANSDYLTFHELLAYSAAKGKSLFQSPSLLFEMAKRLYMGLAPLTLTLLGLAFGTRIGRRPSKKGLIITSILTAIFLSAFIAAKSFHNLILPFTAIFLLPHLIIQAISAWKLRIINRGIE